MANIQKKLGLICLISAIIILSLSLAYVLLIYSSFLTPAGSLIIFILSIWLFFTRLTRIIIYPGSAFYYLHSIELKYCRELSLNLITKLKEIIINTENPNSADRVNSSTSAYDFALSFQTITQIKGNLERLSNENLINRSQKKLLSDLAYLISILDIYNGQQEYYDKQEDISLDGSQEIEQIKVLCNRIIKYLLWYTSTNWFMSLVYYLFYKPLGDLNYMRSSIMAQVNAEQFWLTTEDKCKIDW